MRGWLHFNLLFMFGAAMHIQGCITKTDEVIDIPGRAFLGIQPTDSLQLVAPGIVSTSLGEYNGTFSPDGAEFYYTVSFPGRSVIASMKLNSDNTWSKPAIAVFSGKYSDVDPLLSPDGNRLLFTSFRPIHDSIKTRRANVWCAERTGDGWSTPQPVPLTEDGDYYSSITNSGAIYFNVWKTGDIYRAVKTGSTYTIMKVSNAINSNNAEGDPFISPNEDYLIFRSYNRNVCFGAADLYISFHIGNEWTEPENLGASINSSEDDICPLVTPDGKLFIFASNRFVEEFSPDSLEPIKRYESRFKSFDNGSFNIYSISAAFIEQLRKKHK
jgi:hypothetical protein